MIRAYLARPASARRASEAGVAPAILAILAGGAILGLLTGIIWGPVGEAIKVLASVADGVVAKLPDAGNLGLTVPAGLIYGYTIMDTFLPLHEALTLVVGIVALIVAGITLRVAVMVWHLIPKPGIGT